MYVSICVSTDLFKRIVLTQVQISVKTKRNKTYELFITYVCDFNRLIQSSECDQTLRENLFIINHYHTEHSHHSPRAIILEILVGSQKNGFTFQ